MIRTILVSFQNESDREMVKQNLRACIPANSEVRIRDFDDPSQVLNELRNTVFACAVVELPEQIKLEECALGSIETPIIFVIDRTHPESKNRHVVQFPHVFCDKSQFNSEWLNAYLPLLFDRNRLLIELKDALQPFERKDLDKEITNLMSWYYRTTATAQAMGLGTVREAAPEKFQDMVDLYCRLMETSLEEKTFRMPTTSSTTLHNLSQQLGLLNAGPRDVIELYATSLKHKVGNANHARSRALANSGQVIALELMGYLVSYYRNLARLALHRVAGPAEE